MQPGDVIRSGLAEIELRKPAKSITEVELEARAHGLSYGKYLAGYRLDRELELAARRRQEEIREIEMIQKIRDKGRRIQPGGRGARRVAQVTDEGKVLAVYGSMHAAAAATGCSQAEISIGCKQYERAQKGETRLRRTRKGFRWRFAD